jgi:hypothetical protein
VGQRKGFNRYTTEELQQLVATLAQAQQQQEEAGAGILQVGQGGGGQGHKELLSEEPFI